MQGSVFAYSDELDEWMKNRGRDVADDLVETGKLVLVPLPVSHPEPVHRIEKRDSDLISSSAKARSAELLALANQMWEVLSHRNLEVVARLLREAIELDPENGAAFAGLSHALITAGVWGLLSAPVAYATAESALQKAIKIDPELHAAKSAMAWLKLVLERDWQGAGGAFDEVLEHDPTSNRALIGRALLHVAEGNLKEASGLLLNASRQNALSTFAAALHCWTAYLGGGLSQALDRVGEYRVSGRFGPFVDAVEALTFIQLEEPKVYVKHIEALASNSPDHTVLQGALGYAYGVSGLRQKARELLDVLTNPKKRCRNREPYAVALILIGLNERQKAMQWLEESYRQGSLWSLGFLSDPMLDTLRDDPHFRLFMSKVSYPAPEKSDSRVVLAG
jgi:tetratricopeptide (TPR) repeat protein